MDELLKKFASDAPATPKDYEAIVKKVQKWLDNIQVEPSWVDLFVLQDILNGRDK
jgi:hypothetical protein